MATIIDAIKSKATTESVQTLIDKLVPQERGTLDNYTGKLKYALAHATVENVYFTVEVRGTNPMMGFVICSDKNGFPYTPYINFGAKTVQVLCFNWQQSSTTVITTFPFSKFKAFTVIE